jgi:hypothetical protein
MSLSLRRSRRSTIGSKRDATKAYVDPHLLKGGDLLEPGELELRPVFHWTAPRVRAHVLLCMLAYYLQWHMRRGLAPMLFDEPDPAAPRGAAHLAGGQGRALTGGCGARPPANAPTLPSLPSRKRGEPLTVQRFQTLFGDLATLTRNVVRLERDCLTAILATPPAPSCALDFLGITQTA